METHAEELLFWLICFIEYADGCFERCSVISKCHSPLDQIALITGAVLLI